MILNYFSYTNVKETIASDNYEYMFLCMKNLAALAIKMSVASCWLSVYYFIFDVFFVISWQRNEIKSKLEDLQGDEMIVFSDVRVLLASMPRK